jgi:hypothetical protein
MTQPKPLVIAGNKLGAGISVFTHDHMLPGEVRNSQPSKKMGGEAQANPRPKMRTPAFA